MTDQELLFNLLELAGSHTKSMSPGIRDGFGTTEEVLARFEEYCDALRIIRYPRTTWGSKGHPGA